MKPFITWEWMVVRLPSRHELMTGSAWCGGLKNDDRKTRAERALTPPCWVLSQVWTDGSRIFSRTMNRKLWSEKSIVNRTRAKRLFRFSLLALLIAIAVVSVLMAIGVKRANNQKAVIAWATKAGDRPSMILSSTRRTKVLGISTSAENGCLTQRLLVPFGLETRLE